MAVFQKASEISDQTSKLSVLIYGNTGSGKTGWCANSPKPLFLSTESQGLATVQALNPNAIFVSIKNWDEFAQIINAIENGKVEIIDGQQNLIFSFSGEKVAFQTLVIDSLSDLQNMLLEKQTGIKKADGISLSRKQLTLQEWGIMKDVMLSLLRTLRSLKCSVICICLAEEKTVNDDSGLQVSKIVPLFSGKISEMIGQFFNLVGYVSPTKPIQDKNTGKMIDNPVKSVVSFKPDTRFYTKPAPNMPLILDARKSFLGSVLLTVYPNSNSVPHNPTMDKKLSIAQPKADKKESQQDKEN